MYTFRDLKRALFESTSAAIPGYAELTESAFIELLFPEQFLKAVVVVQDRTISFANIFRNKAQRNKLINGKYTGYVLMDGIGPLLRNSPEIWDSIREKCNYLTEQADIAVLKEIVLEFSLEIKNRDLLSVIHDAVNNDASFALAVMLILVIGFNQQNTRYRLMCLLWDIGHGILGA